MGDTYRLELKSIFTEAEKVLPFIETIGHREQLSEELVDRAKLALNEAASNAIVHGNREDPAKRVEILATIEPGTLRFDVRDEGDGFDPTAPPDPVRKENLLETGGRGLFLIREYCDKVSFGDHGRCVTLLFDRDRPLNN
ncbi:MAG: ATP-binding protein [Balneolaceae bacterium]